MNPKHTFYVPPSSGGNLVVLPLEEGRHADRVLRLRAGAQVFLVDGEGTRSTAVLEGVSKRQVTARIESSTLEPPALGMRVTVGAALLKNASRYETMLEKAAELGAQEIVPLLTSRSERSKFREDRARAILIGAMKQSGSAYLTAVGPPVRFDDFLTRASPDSLNLVCHEGATPEQAILARLRGVTAPQVLICVGPEGGFSDDEIASANAAGFLTTSLGRARLRAETASIIALAAFAIGQPN
ncbi:MAG: 16S rRNA (uracil1498-N3)-methyltransferase [Rhodothermales bacterium]|jgi:16S rRNA (uracil1498-N3)-methyltransferase